MVGNGLGGEWKGETAYEFKENAIYGSRGGKTQVELEKIEISIVDAM
jgi:hypothetical protein